MGIERRGCRGEAIAVVLGIAPMRNGLAKDVGHRDRDTRLSNGAAVGHLYFSLVDVPVSEDAVASKAVV
jgi:hypothetical protein